MYRGIDCYAPLTRAKAEAAKAAGFDFAGRYLVPYGYDKALTETEARAISAAGLGLLCVWETTDSRAREGAAAGYADGLRALECARRIGMPVSGIIYFAVDFGAGPGDFPAIADYMQAAGEEIKKGGYRLGVYGSYSTVEAMAERGAASAFWQCVGWSGGRISEHMDIYQRYWSGSPEAREAAVKIGVSVDINECGDMEKAGIWMYEEDRRMEINRIIEAMTDEQAGRIVEKAQQFFAKMPMPGSWDAEGELEEAVRAGITDGTRPMNLCTRLEAAVMVKRAIAGKPPDDKDFAKDINAPGKVVWENADDHDQPPASEAVRENAEEATGYCADCDVEKILKDMEDDGK